MLTQLIREINRRQLSQIKGSYYSVLVVSSSKLTPFKLSPFKLSPYKLSPYKLSPLTPLSNSRIARDRK
jgi:hypothetical protein